MATIEEIKDKTNDQCFKDGMETAWELANKILSMNGGTLTKIFGTDYLIGNECSSGIFYIFKKYSSQEVLDKIKAYEDSKKLKVGDIVEIDRVGIGVVTAIQEQSGYVTVLCSVGTACWLSSSNIKKTGRHIDMEAILDYIGETDPDKLPPYTVIGHPVENDD